MPGAVKDKVFFGPSQPTLSAELVESLCPKLAVLELAFLELAVFGVGDVRT